MKELQMVTKLNNIIKLFKRGEQVSFDQLLEMSDITMSQLLMDINNYGNNKTPNMPTTSIEREEYERIQINKLRNNLRLKAIEKRKFLQINIEDLLIDVILKMKFDFETIQAKIDRAIDMCRNSSGYIHDLQGCEIIKVYEYIKKALQRGDTVSFELLQKICDISMSTFLGTLNTVYTQNRLSRIKNNLRLKAITKRKFLPSYIENIIIKSLSDENISNEEIDKIIEACPQLNYSNEFLNGQDRQDEHLL